MDRSHRHLPMQSERNRAIHVGFGGKIYHRINVIFTEKSTYGFPVANIGTHEAIAIIASDISHIRKITGIGELVDVDNENIPVLSHHIANKVTSDKSGSTGNKIGLAH